MGMQCGEKTGRCSGVVGMMGPVSAIVVMIMYHDILADENHHNKTLLYYQSFVMMLHAS